MSVTSPEAEPVIPHAIQRAKERYGIDLSVDDLTGLSARCQAGEGRTGGTEDGAQFHVLILRDRVLWLVYRRPVPPHKFGSVVTVMPASVGAAMTKRGAREKFRRLNGYAKRGR